jgi:hypothetical protein
MVDFDPAIINKVFENTDPVEVKPEMIERFCKAIGETNPLYTDADAASRGPYGTIVAPPSKTGRTGTMVFVVIRSTLSNQKGETLAHIDHRFMNRP